MRDSRRDSTGMKKFIPKASKGCFGSDRDGQRRVGSVGIERSESMPTGSFRGTGRSLWVALSHSS